jgi:hypothetical protein
MQTPDVPDHEEVARMAIGSGLIDRPPVAEQQSGSLTSSSTSTGDLGSTRDTRVTTNPHRISRRPAPSDASRREEVQQHLDARTARLQAYVTSLEAALDASPSGEQAAQLERRLAQSRRDLQTSVRSRIPAQVLPGRVGRPERAILSEGEAAAS